MGVKGKVGARCALFFFVCLVVFCSASHLGGGDSLLEMQDEGAVLSSESAELLGPETPGMPADHLSEQRREDLLDDADRVRRKKFEDSEDGLAEEKLLRSESPLALPKNSAANPRHPTSPKTDEDDRRRNPHTTPLLLPQSHPSLSDHPFFTPAFFEEPFSAIQRGFLQRSRLHLDKISGSVVKIFVDSASPDYISPWQMKAPQQTTGSGFAIEGKRILTNAHVVAQQTRVLVRRHGIPLRFIAEVLAVSHEADLALLGVKDEDFWTGLLPLHFGGVPELQDRITVLGYPAGGDQLSITEGVVSRVGVSRYVHGSFSLLTAQIDAAINPGNSGGPAVVHGAVVGVAFEGFNQLQNVGYVVPYPVIRQFLNDLTLHGRYTGIPTLGVKTLDMENPSMRRAKGLDDVSLKEKYLPPGITLSGILIVEVDDLRRKRFLTGKIRLPVASWPIEQSFLQSASPPSSSSLLLPEVPPPPAFSTSSSAPPRLPLHHYHPLAQHHDDAASRLGAPPHPPPSFSAPAAPPHKDSREESRQEASPARLEPAEANPAEASARPLPLPQGRAASAPEASSHANNSSPSSFLSSREGPSSSSSRAPQHRHPPQQARLHQSAEASALRQRSGGSLGNSRDALGEDYAAEKRRGGAELAHGKGIRTLSKSTEAEEEEEKEKKTIEGGDNRLDAAGSRKREKMLAGRNDEADASRQAPGGRAGGGKKKDFSASSEDLHLVDNPYFDEQTASSLRQADLDDTLGLKPGDVLLSIENTDIANDGTIPFRGLERVSIEYALLSKFNGEVSWGYVLRDRRILKVSIPLSVENKLVPTHVWDASPKYFVYGGLVFTSLTKQFVKGKMGSSDGTPVFLLNYVERGLFQQDEDDEIIVLSTILASDVTIGYEAAPSVVVSVQGVRVRCLSQLASLIEASADRFVTFLLEIQNSEQLPLILDREDATRVTPEILAKHKIATDRSLHYALLHSPSSP